LVAYEISAINSMIGDKKGIRNMERPITTDKF